MTPGKKRAVIAAVACIVLLSIFYSGFAITAAQGASIDGGSVTSYVSSSSPSSFSLTSKLSQSGEVVVLSLAMDYASTGGNDYSTFTFKINGIAMTWVGGDGGGVVSKFGSSSYGEDTWIYNASSISAGSITISATATTTGKALAVVAYGVEGASLTGTIGTVASGTSGSFSYTPSLGSGLVVWSGGVQEAYTWVSPITAIDNAVESTVAKIYTADGPIQSYSSEATLSGALPYLTGIEIFSAGGLAYSVILSSGKTYFSVTFATGAGTNVQAAPGQSSSVAAIQVSITSGTATAITLAINRTLPSAMHIQYSVNSNEPSLGSNYLSTTAVTLYSNLAAPSTGDVWLWFVVQNQVVGTSTLNETVGILVAVS